MCYSVYCLLICSNILPPLSNTQTLKDVFLLLPQSHLPTLVVSLVSLVLLITAKEINAFLSPRLPVPIPVELITVR